MDSLQKLLDQARYTGRLAGYYASWGRVQLKYAVQIAWIDLRIFWCDVKIFFYG